jgi:hypothetical protein
VQKKKKKKTPGAFILSFSLPRFFRILAFFLCLPVYKNETKREEEEEERQF